MSPTVVVEYKPRCAVCGTLGITPWMLCWLASGQWHALCEDCSLFIVVLAGVGLVDVPEST